MQKLPPNPGVPNKYCTCFNYSFLICWMLCIVKGKAGKHISFINAIYCCKYFDIVKKRYIQEVDIKFGATLSDAKKANKNLPQRLEDFFQLGIFNGIQYEVPSAERFRDIVEGNPNFRISESDELLFRDAVRKCIREEYNPHLMSSDCEKLVTSADHDDIYTFIFKCFDVAISRRGNTVNRRVKKSELERTTQTALQVEATISKEIAELHELDDSV